MIYRITASNLDIINHLVFDASVQSDDLKKLTIGKPIEFEIERRCLEDVNRKRFPFWTTTSFGGKKSLIRFSGVSKVEFEGIDEVFTDNHFINELTFNPQSKVLEMNTSFGLSVKFTFCDELYGQLIDIRDSDYGAGQLMGSKGFTKEEWETKLKLSS
ncbi:hypothetical protein [Pontibacter pudoricolor]|uniref:hypothetical protein n=1 Tax=Pontibacter pudoricolor TaxID=2694930 RepID=UPI0013919B4F|nr:hypothetical protein [Pontibacter pudoricolor]